MPRNLHERVAVTDAAVADTVAACLTKSEVAMHRAVMTLYLKKSWCRSFRFQLTLASKLLRFRRWVPELK